MSKRKYFKAGDAVYHRGRGEWGTFYMHCLGQHKCWVEFEDEDGEWAAHRVSTKQLSFSDAETDQQD